MPPASLTQLISLLFRQPLNDLSGRLDDFIRAFSEIRFVLGARGLSWRTGYAGSGFRWGKRIPKRCGGSRARRENSTAVAWKGRRNGRGASNGGRYRREEGRCHLDN